MKSVPAMTYFTGKPCKRGHVAPRFVSTRNCVQCNKERMLVKNLTEVEIHLRRASARVEYWKDPEKSRARNRLASRKHYALNKERIIYETNLHYKKRHKRIPLWADLEAIKEFYKNCPEGYEVDHIIPLQGGRVSGLHVLDNLQYLTVAANRAKGNGFTV